MMDCDVEIRIPDHAENLDQNEEWIEISTEEGSEKIRLHEYDRFYEIPGLYDGLYRRLKCQSPKVVCTALKEEMAKSGETIPPIRALDFGAGNGQVGERLSKEMECELIVGLDIIPQARDAALRDRPRVYEEYYVKDLAHLGERDRNTLSQYRFNTLVTVAALGFGDIGTKAFVNAINLVEDGGWIAFNIKDRFLSEEDETGFQQVITSFSEQGFQSLHCHRYCHRYSLSGMPLHYYAIVGRKQGDVKIH